MSDVAEDWPSEPFTIEALFNELRKNIEKAQVSDENPVTFERMKSDEMPSIVTGLRDKYLLKILENEKKDSCWSEDVAFGLFMNHRMAPSLPETKLENPQNPLFGTVEYDHSNDTNQGTLAHFVEEQMRSHFKWKKEADGSFNWWDPNDLPNKRFVILFPVLQDDDPSPDDFHHHMHDGNGKIYVNHYKQVKFFRRLKEVAAAMAGAAKRGSPTSIVLIDLGANAPKRLIRWQNQQLPALQVRWTEFTEYLDFADWYRQNPQEYYNVWGFNFCSCPDFITDYLKQILSELRVPSYDLAETNRNYRTSVHGKVGPAASDSSNDNKENGTTAMVTKGPKQKFNWLGSLLVAPPQPLPESWEPKEVDTAKICAACSKTPAKKTCARCLTTRYCSKQCQKAHWKSHKKSCGKDTTIDIGSGQTVKVQAGLPPGMKLGDITAGLPKDVALDKVFYVNTQDIRI